MFEHLGPLPEIKIRKKPTKLKIYWLLLLLLVVGALVLSAVNIGPRTQAAKQPVPIILLLADQNAKQTVVHTSPVPVFSLLVKSSLPVNLQLLKIAASGVYDSDVLANLKLYHHNIQIGQLSSVDEEGNIYFELNNYTLPAGDNVLDLVLSDSGSLLVGDILQFSLFDNHSLVVYHQNEQIFPQADFPLRGGTTMIVASGKLVAYNNSPESKNILSTGQSSVANFFLAADSEIVDLNDLHFLVAGQNLDQAEFSLLLGQETIATSQPVDDKLDFILAKKLVLSTQQLLELSLIADGLSAGDYNFSLRDAGGQGFVSGQNIKLDKTLALGSVHVQDDLLQFASLPIDKKLTKGWNLIYNFQVKTLGSNDLAIQKLSWQADVKNLAIAKMQLMVDGQEQAADIIFKDNKIIAKLAASQPIRVGNAGSQVKLLARIDDIKPGGRIESYLLSDSAALAGDIWLNNILWSVDNHIHNGYLLAGVPLDPQVLDN
ncbi:MAG: hypothetical protein WC465_01645 [Patescibacteria group bacterium]